MTFSEEYAPGPGDMLPVSMLPFNLAPIVVPCFSMALEGMLYAYGETMILLSTSLTLDPMLKINTI